MTATAEVPKYKLLADHFFEPMVVSKGSTIEFDGVPNHLMEPLNPSAVAALDAWYEESFPLLDDKTGKQVVNHKGEPQSHQPRLELRPPSQRPNAPKAAGIRVLSEPAPAEVNAAASIAAMQFAPAKEWKQPEGTTATTPLEPESTPPGVKVVEPAPPTSTVTVKTGATA